MLFPKISRGALFALAFLWASITGSGFFLLGAHNARPGRAGMPPTRWPGECPIPLDPSRSTLLIFLHPRCPCSRASLDELASVVATSGDRFVAHAILYRPEQAPEGWDRAEAKASEGLAVPGLQIWADRGGELGRRFGVETSGHVLLFDPSGALLFGGGITPSRGHRGENPGLEALVARNGRGEVGPSKSPVFGCPILERGATPGRETAR
jgi:hypothetical protein